MCRWCDSTVAEYLRGPHYGSERLDARDRCNEYVMTGLRTARGISLAEAAVRFGAERARRLERGAARWLASGTLVRDGERLYIPSARLLVSDAVIASLFEA